MKAGTENLDTGATTLGSRRRFLKLGAAAVLARSLPVETAVAQRPADADDAGTVRHALAG